MIVGGYVPSYTGADLWRLAEDLAPAPPRAQGRPLLPTPWPRVAAPTTPPPPARAAFARPRAAAPVPPAGAAPSADVLASSILAELSGTPAFI
jgi:hypothetical protein